MHVNVSTIVGRVNKPPQLRYAENGTPCCSLVVEVEEHGKDGATFLTWLPVEISGRYAEQTSVEVEAGDEVLISGKLKYKSPIDSKTQQKTSKLIVSSWGIQQRIPALAGVSVNPRSEPDVAPEPSNEGLGRATIKPRKPRYSKWRPGSSN
jgi:single-stranded DNA-binding protein